MDTIVQLSQEKHEELVYKAYLVDEKIEKRAKELYEQYGTHQLKINVTADEYEDEIVVKASSRVKDWDSKYPLQEEDKKKIIRFVNRKAEELFRGSFGNAIYNIELLKKKQTILDNQIKKNLAITVTGWLVAISMLILWLYFA